MADEGCSHPCAGDPINPATGNEHNAENDIVAIGAVNPLSFTRFYNSIDSFSRDLGPGWRHSYSRKIVLQYSPQEGAPSATRSSKYTDLATACTSGWAELVSQNQGWSSTTASWSGSVCSLSCNGAAAGAPTVYGGATQPPASPVLVGAQVVRDDGHILFFSYDGSSFIAEPGVATRLQQGSGGYQLIDEGDNVEQYDTSGKLQTVSDRAGHPQVLSYDVAGRLDQVTDFFSRQLVFGYDASNRLHTVTDPAGSYTYDYDANGNFASVTYPDHKFRRYVYEDSRFPHALTGIIDENTARYATWSYDAQGRTRTSEHAGGTDKVTLDYNSDGSSTITEVTGAIRTDAFQKTGSHLLNTSVSGQPCMRCGDRLATTYDANGFVASTQDFNGNLTNYVNDARGRETSRTEAYGTSQARTITTIWHPVYRLPTEIDEPGRTTTFGYEATTGNLLSKTVTDTTTGESRNWSFTYDPATKLLHTSDGPRTDVNDVTTFDYDSQGNLSAITNALNQSTQIPDHDADGNPLTIIDPNGIHTTLTYDARHRLKTRTIGNAATQFDWYDTGLLKTVTLPDSSSLTYSYDAAHCLTDINDNLGNRIHYTLDAQCNRRQEDVYDPGSTLKRTRSQVFDAVGQLHEIHGANGQFTILDYDNERNLKKQTVKTSSGDFVTKNDLDALNRLYQTTDAANSLTQYQPNVLDQLVQVTDPKGLITKYTYNALGDLKKLESPDTGTTLYTYDSGSNRATSKNARGVLITYSYDALNRVTSAVYFQGSPENVSYQYDGSNDSGVANGIGRLTGITDQSGTTTLRYDERGNLVAELRNSGGSPSVTVYTYDAADHVIGMTYPTGRQVGYERDSLGRVARVTTTVNGVITTVADSIQYLPFGGISGYTLGNDIQIAKTFDQDYRLQEQKDQGNAVVRNVRLYYDDRDDLQATEDVGDANRSQSFDYDALQRLKYASGSYGTRSYGYDSVGNRISESVALPGSSGYSATYNYPTTSNRLDSITGGYSVNFGYDPAGNITQKNDLSLNYDLAGHVAFSSRGGGSIDLVQNLYNARGQRIRKVSGADTEFFHYDQSGHLLAELRSDSPLKREYLWLGDLPLSISEVSVRPQAIVDDGDFGYTSSGGFTSASSPAANGGDYQIHGATAAASVIRDDGDAGTSKTGAWITTSLTPSGYYGSGYTQTLFPNTSAAFTWNVPLPTAGTYKVEARWVNLTNNCTACKYTVTHLNGSTDSIVNQRTESGQWHTLGTYDFTGPAVIRLSNPSGNGVMVADAVRVSRVTQPGPAQASWAAPDAAEYQVYIRYPTYATYSPHAPITIRHAAGTTHTTVNEQTNGGGTLIGTFTFSDPATQGVTLDADSDYAVVADAVVFIPTPASSTRTVLGYNHTDQLGTIQKITGADQSILWDAVYEPFGAKTVNNNRIGNPMRMPGQYEDTETGLYQNRYRDYDPAVGRYVQSDPIGLVGGINTYAYVGGNPMRFGDPSGLESPTISLMGLPGGTDLSDFAAAVQAHIELDQQNLENLANTLNAAQNGDPRALTEVAMMFAGGGITRTLKAEACLYRGVHASHAALTAAKKGVVVPGNVSGTVSAAEHNLGGVSSQSPFTSWTRDIGVARDFANSNGPGGVILRLPEGAPAPGATWSWELSPDIFGEQEVLLRGIRTDAMVIPP